MRRARKNSREELKTKGKKTRRYTSYIADIYVVT